METRINQTAREQKDKTNKAGNIKRRWDRNYYQSVKEILEALKEEVQQQKKAINQRKKENSKTERKIKGRKKERRKERKIKGMKKERKKERKAQDISLEIIENI